MNDHRFVFVCGLQRSGTTMLYRYLSEHPEISKLEGTDRKGNEGQHNQTVYPDPDRYGRAGGFAFQPEARLTEDSPLVTDANRDKLFGEWARYWDLSRPVLMEKSPPNVIRSRFLQAMFPESSFVFITRHPIAVSSATQKWSDTRPRSLVRHWLEAHRLMLEDIPHLRRAHVLRYEDMVADPDGVLARVFGFLCLEDFDAQRQVAEGINQDNFYADRTLRTGVNDKYFTEWRGPGRRRTLVRRLYYEMVDRSAERAVNRFGYSMLHPERLTTPTVALPGLGSMAAQTARL